jgi:hypothetical protein
MLQQVSPGNLQVVLKHNSDYMMDKGKILIQSGEIFLNGLLGGFKKAKHKGKHLAPPIGILRYS